MTVTASTYSGEKITVRRRSITEALGILKAGGVSEDWIFELEARADEATH